MSDKVKIYIFHIHMLFTIGVICFYLNSLNSYENTVYAATPSIATASVTTPSEPETQQTDNEIILFDFPYKIDSILVRYYGNEGYLIEYGSEEFSTVYKCYYNDFYKHEKAYIRPGYVFKEWNTEKEGGGISVKANELDLNLQKLHIELSATKDGFKDFKDIKLYAQWDKISVPATPSISSSSGGGGITNTVVKKNNLITEVPALHQEPYENNTYIGDVADVADKGVRYISNSEKPTIYNNHVPTVSDINEDSNIVTQQITTNTDTVITETSKTTQKRMKTQKPIESIINKKSHLNSFLGALKLVIKNPKLFALSLFIILCTIPCILFILSKSRKEWKVKTPDGLIGYCYSKNTVTGKSKVRIIDKNKVIKKIYPTSTLSFIDK